MTFRQLKPNTVRYSLKAALVLCLLLGSREASAEKAAKQTPYRSQPLTKEQNQGVVTLDYLIFRAVNENLVYAENRINFEDPGAYQNIVSQANMVRPKMTWRPGFRLGFGWNSPYDRWDINATWTYYYNKSVTNFATADVQVPTNEEGMRPYWGAAVAPSGSLSYRDPYQNMEGVWQLNYNMLNLGFSRPIQLLQKTILSPFLDIQSGWIYQKISVEYLRNLASLALASRHMDMLIHMNNKFWGIGLCLGVDGSTKLGYGFSLLTNLSGSLLSGRTTASRIQSVDPTTGRGYLRATKDSFRYLEIVPGARAALGLRWQKVLTDSGTTFHLDANWESIYWWGLLDLAQPAVSFTSFVNYRRLGFKKYPFPNKGLHMEGVSIRGQLTF